MHKSLIDIQGNDANAVLAVRATYRSRFGLPDPKSGEIVRIAYMEVMKFYIVWVDAVDGENILQKGFSTKEKAKQYADSFGWVVQPDR